MNTRAALEARISSRTINLLQQHADMVLLGTGNVGGELIRQLVVASNLPIRVLGSANSRQMIFDPCGIMPAGIAAELETGAYTQLDLLAARLRDACVVTPIIVDATASEEVAARHAGWLRSGIHVVTANKIAAAKGWIAEGECAASYGDSATVMAGLPVLRTIRRLRAAGDVITRIEGVLSGSLAYLFNAMASGTAFSAAVRHAHASGYCEPDPREDLSGGDVARKIAILARAAGLSVPGVIDTSSLFDDGQRSLSADEFLLSLDDHDRLWQKRFSAATARGKTLRYVASLDANGVLDIGVRELAIHHPLATISGTENCLAIYSDTYRDHPVVIRGPGAGAAVTARALLADVVDIALNHGGSAVGAALKGDVT